MLECILLVVMYAKLLNIIKGLIDPSIEGLSISMLPTLTHISMDIKHMPPSKEKFLYILVLLCEASNFIVCSPYEDSNCP